MTLKVGNRLFIPESEFSITYVRSSGPGGQNVNKVNSKAVLKWHVATSPSTPEDVKHRFIHRHGSRINSEGFFVVSSDESRSQLQNLKSCFFKLERLLEEVLFPPKTRKKTKPSRSQKEKRIQKKKKTGEKKKLRRLNSKKIFEGSY